MMCGVGLIEMFASIIEDDHKLSPDLKCFRTPGTFAISSRLTSLQTIDCTSLTRQVGYRLPKLRHNFHTATQSTYTINSNGNQKEPLPTRDTAHPSDRNGGTFPIKRGAHVTQYHLEAPTQRNGRQG